MDPKHDAAKLPLHAHVLRPAGSESEGGTLLVYIDESGDEHLTDPNYRVFGLGGCAVRFDRYEVDLAAGWRAMKRLMFGGENTQMHASRLEPTEAQIAGLAHFFRTSPFYRLAALVNDESTLTSDGLSRYEVVASKLVRNIAVILGSHARCDHVRLFFEASQRGDRLAKAFMQRLSFVPTSGTISVSWNSVSKETQEPGLEVADFVMHTAGVQTRHMRRGSRPKRKDFKCVFQDVPSDLVQFSYITKFGLTHNPAGTLLGVLIDPRESGPIRPPPGAGEG